MKWLICMVNVGKCIPSLKLTPKKLVYLGLHLFSRRELSVIRKVYLRKPTWNQTDGSFEVSKNKLFSWGLSPQSTPESLTKKCISFLVANLGLFPK